MAEHLLGGAARGAATVSGDLTRSPTRVQVSHVAVEVAEQGTTSALIAHVAVEVAQRGTTSALVAHVAVEVAELLLWVITEAQVQGSATVAGTLTVTGKAQITWVAVDVSGTIEGSARTTESFVEVVGTAAAGDARTTEGFVEVLFAKTFGENRIIWLF